MVNDPYAVLGVERGASEDEIKKAYRRKAKECHPDLHPDDPDATRKMNDVNEAYDMLMHPEKYEGRSRSYGQQQDQSSQGAYRQQGYYGNYNGGYSGNSQGQQGYGPYGSGPYNSGQSGPTWFTFDDLFGFGGAGSAYAEPPQEEAMDTPEIRQSVRMINTQRYQEALNILSNIQSHGRDARWHYLSALVHYGLGNTMTAVEEIQKAIQLDPNNPVYQRTYQAYRRSASQYDQRSRGFTRSAADPSKWCMTFCLMNLFCNCCCRRC